MKIVSYNVNGLRSALSKGLLDWVAEAAPDVLCLQEIKAGREAMDVSGFEALGYRAYLHPARKEASTADADLSQPDFQASDKTIIYTRAELAELQQQQPGDVLKTQLVGVRRKK